MEQEEKNPRPTSRQLEEELKRVEYGQRYRAALKSTVGWLLIVAALSVLAASLWLPVLRIYGSSMAPTLQNGELLLCVKTENLERGDIVAFYHSNKLLVKRILALPGEQAEVKEDGTVYVGGQPLDEPYISEKAFGQGDVGFPLQIPEERFFVLGDNRASSVDSRHSAVGCAAREQIIGKVIFRIWPLNRLGIIQ